jgi:NAD(P)-dependent dehydrogenase (short-subunit alcohol dehydrogenase family)
MAASSPPSSRARYPSLQGRTVFVTGGASGIGADLVAAFVEQGARVGFIDLDADAGRRTADAAGAGITCFHAGDVTRNDALDAALQATRARFGDITVLVNNVANDRRHAMEDVDEAFFDAAIAVNLKPAFFAAQRVVPDMRRGGGGVIVNIGSTGWKNKVAGYVLYAACKSAMNGLTRTLARELGRDGIRVNTLTPGWVMTEKQRRLWVDEAAERAMDEHQCLPGRLVGEDVAALALFLAADDSRMVTAQEFVVDAGWS